MTRALVVAWVIVLVALLGMAAVRWRRGESRSSAALLVPQGERFAARREQRPTLNFSVRDPFRLSHRPARVRYGSAANDPAFPAPFGREPGAEPLSMMTLRAIAGGPPWQALIEGLPGQPHPMLVRIGTVVGGMAVRAITRDSVVIRDRDTTLVLTFARRR